MNLDFPTILVLAVLVTGIIWLIDILVWAPGRRRKRLRMLAAAGPGAGITRIENSIREPRIVEYARSFFPVILAVLILRSFVVEPFRIPSNSMMPTLLTGDFILVNKFDYGLRLPVIDKKVIEIDEPKRGEVVVFRYPRDPSVDYIKRVVGLPGDRVVYDNKHLYINGKPMEQQAQGVYTGVGAGEMMSGASLRKEHLGDITHTILVRPGQYAMEGTFTVPPGEYFVMGDNRDNSNDSRYWGTVPEKNLVGKAFLIWMNWDPSNGGVNWGRIGLRIK